PSSPSAISGATGAERRRRWAKRLRSSGSVSRRVPATSIRTVAWPANVMRPAIPEASQTRGRSGSRSGAGAPALAGRNRADGPESGSSLGQVVVVDGLLRGQLLEQQAELVGEQPGTGQTESRPGPAFTREGLQDTDADAVAEDRNHQQRGAALDAQLLELDAVGPRVAVDDLHRLPCVDDHPGRGVVV